MSDERWAQVNGYPNYSVSNEGAIRSRARGSCRIMSTKPDRHGYPKVMLCRNGTRTTKSVHSLVAEAFVDGYRDGMQVNHIDGVKTNNRASNLEWVSQADNIRHAYTNRLNAGPRGKRVRVVETGCVYASEIECAEAVGGSKAGINGCLKGRRRTHKGLHYEYAE